MLLRLALHQLPSKEMAISSWLALGPIGTGALALLLLGEQAPRILTAVNLAEFRTGITSRRCVGSPCSTRIWCMVVWNCYTHHAKTFTRFTL